MCIVSIACIFWFKGATTQKMSRANEFHTKLKVPQKRKKKEVEKWKKI